MTGPARFLATADRLTDRETGLAWDRTPSFVPVSWAEAEAAAAGQGTRLPKAVELLSLVAALPETFLLGPRPGDVLWSSSTSPFAPVSRVRAVACDGPGRFVLVLRERADPAGFWGVRVNGVHVE